MSKILRLLASTFGAAGAAFLLQVVLARILSIDEYGEYASINSLIAMVAPLACAGIGGFLLRKASVNPREIFSLTSAAASSLFFSSAIAVAATVVVLSSGGLNPVVVFALATMYWALATQALLTVQSQLQSKSFLLASAQIVQPVIRLLLVLLVGVYFSTLVDIALALALANVTSAVVYYVVSVKLGARFMLQVRAIGATIFGSIPYSVNAAINVAQIQMSVTFAAVLFGHKEAAVFSAAITLLNAVYILPNTIFSLHLLPSYHKLDISRDFLRFVKASFAAIAVGVVIALALSATANLIITTFFGAKFGDSVRMLQIIMWAVPFRFYSTSIGAALLTERLVGWKVASSGLGLVVQLCVFYAAGHLGIDWLAYAVVIGELVIAIAYTIVFVSRKRSS